MRSSRLYARKQTMKDESGGLQHFLFSWIGLPHIPVITKQGQEAEVYLENLAPLFFVDQNEGWTDLQALQVCRYGLQEISEVAVEYLLGATDALKTRVDRQARVAQQAELKGIAASLASQVTSILGKQGWVYDWSAQGNISEIAKRWSARSLFDVTREMFHFDLATEQEVLRRRAVTLRDTLSGGILSPMDTGAASDASQEVIDLKTRRHLLREELRTCRTQAHEQRQLAESLEHRIRSAKDVLRLKRDGIGRLESVECPTCHRSLDTVSFALTTQSVTSVATHVDALERDRLLVLANVHSVEAQTTRLAADLARVEELLNASERALANVNIASGAVREQLTKAAMDLASVERQIEKNTMLASDLEEIQKELDAWIVDVQALTEPKGTTLASSQYKFAFEKNLRILLLALGHNDVTPASVSDVRLDEQYIPYLGRRRLRSLGSASDHSRLVAAYVLALAETSRELVAPHPGFVILDEPLQQNPDPKHRDLFIGFLEGVAAKNLRYQTIVFTSLTDEELLRLKKAGVHLVIPEDRHFLRRLGTEH